MSSVPPVFKSKMSTLKQVIYQALIKCSTPEHGVVPSEFPTPEAARDAFIALVMTELFPGEELVSSSAASSPATLPERVAARKVTKEEKAAAKAAKLAEKEAAKKAKEDAKAAKEAAKVTPKKSPEEKKAEKAAVKQAEKEAKAAAKAAEKAAKEAEKAAKKAEKVKASPKASPAEKKEAKAAAKVAEKEAKAAAKEAEKAAKALLPASPKAAKKPKAPKPAEDANLQKIDPTWRKHLKTAAKAAEKEVTKEMEGDLLAYLNGLSKEEFNATKAEDHVKVFLAVPSSAPVQTAQETVSDLEAVEIEFEGKTYYVDTKSQRVYVEDGPVFRGVGYVGMAAFTAMEVPTDVD